MKRYQNWISGFFRVFDAFWIGLIWLLCYGLRFNLPLVPVTKGFPDFETYAALTPLVVILWLLVFSTLGVYQPKRLMRRTHEAFQTLRAHLVALLIFITLTYLFSEYRYSRVVMVFFAALGGVGLIFSRVWLRNLLRNLYRRGFQNRKLLAVGDGPTLRGLLEHIRRFPELGLTVSGTIGAQTIPDYSHLGNYDDFESLIEKLRPDEILIALPRNESHRLDGILSKIRDETIDIRLVPDLHEYLTLGCEVEDFNGYPMVNLNESPLEGWGSVAKRLTDIIFSLLGMLVLSPFLLLIGLVIRISSKGPVFYSQERMGLDGRTFRMFKFRTMRVDAESQGAVWAKEDDPRRTFLGKFLRQTSLDELPQLWNVLVGDMSLVGPRPERPVFVNQFRKDIPGYMLRHKVKAGMTGWAQVHGWRGNTSLQRRIEFDLYYIQNWSYLLDLKILALTVLKGFINRNAY